MADKDDDDLLNDLDFDKIAEEKKGAAASDAGAPTPDDFDDSLEDIADLDDELLSSDDLMDDIDDLDDLDDDLGDEEEWDLDDDSDFDPGPAQLSAPKKKSFIGRSLPLIIILLAGGAGAGYFYQEYYLPTQQANTQTPGTPQPQNVAATQTPGTTPAPITPAQPADLTPDPVAVAPGNDIPDLASQTDLPPMPVPVTDISNEPTIDYTEELVIDQAPEDLTELVEALDPTAETPEEDPIDLDFGAESLTPMPEPDPINELPADLSDPDVGPSVQELPEISVAETPAIEPELSPEPFDPLELEDPTDDGETYEAEIDLPPAIEPAPAPVMQNNEQAELLEQLNVELEQKNQELAGKLENADSQIEDLNKKISDLQTQIASLANKPTASKPEEQPKNELKTTPKPNTAPVKTPAPDLEKWELRAALPGKATIARANSNDLRTIEVGDQVSSIGKIQSIEMKNGRWVVQGSKGQITR